MTILGFKVLVLISGSETNLILNSKNSFGDNKDIDSSSHVLSVENSELGFSGESGFDEVSICKEVDLLYHQNINQEFIVLCIALCVNFHLSGHHSMVRALPPKSLMQSIGCCFII